MIKIEINQQSGKKISKDFLNKIIGRALQMSGVKDAEISVAFIGDQKMKEMNKTWRGKNCVTDVLSFVYEQKPLAGEIVVCYPQAVRQAGERGRAAGEEIKLLLIHGALHLVGYDHEKSLSDAKRMENLQNKIVKSLANV
jgi:probable rRNA maturation factor